MNTPTTQLVEITPEMAKRWLEKFNTRNRPVYPGVVEKYAREMKAGAWAVTNQGIGFADDGTLLDGQQRLSAIVLSNTPVKIFVTKGLPKVFKNNGVGELFTQDVIDGGKPRSVGDNLTLTHKIENANQKIAIVNMIVASIKGAVIPLTLRVAHKIIDLYSDEIEMSLSNKSTIRGIYFAPTIAAIALAGKVDYKKAIEFKEKYFKGIGLEDGDPALCLRNYMLERRSALGGGGGPYRRMVMNFAFIALKNHFEGRPLKRLIVSDSGREYFLSKQRDCVKIISDLFK